MEKYKKAISNEHMAFGFSSNENSTQNTPQVKNNNDVEKKRPWIKKKLMIVVKHNQLKDII